MSSTFAFEMAGLGGGVRNDVLDTLFSVNFANRRDDSVMTYGEKVTNVYAFKWATRFQTSRRFVTFNHKFKSVVEISRLAFSDVAAADCLLARMIGDVGADLTCNDYFVVVHSCVSLPAVQMPTLKEVEEVYVQPKYNGLVYYPPQQTFLLVRRWQTMFFFISADVLQRTTYGHLFEDTPEATDVRKTIIDSTNQAGKFIYWLGSLPQPLVITWRNFPYVPSAIFEMLKKKHFSPANGKDVIIWP